MTANNFEDIFQSLEKGVESVATSSLKEYLSQAKTDGQRVLTDLKDNLERWAGEVETGAMTKEDLEFLLQEETALDELVSLKQAGLAAVRIDKFRNSLINMVVDTLFGFIKV
ncbi:hypothetical protein ACFQ4C_07635 [Larkinella insperata]|uniref:Uncharacterized protein n=1 Tax=Larkinella insperata TaxID=332158 RepID=A0ABW3Q5J6_9BACT